MVMPNILFKSNPVTEINTFLGIVRNVQIQFNLRKRKASFNQLNSWIMQINSAKEALKPKVSNQEFLSVTDRRSEYNVLFREIWEQRRKGVAARGEKSVEKVVDELVKDEKRRNFLLR